MHNREKLLIVEDQIITALDIKKYLEDKFEIIGIASSGIEAIEYVKQNRPDIILMDIMINGNLNGIETASFIREEHDIPVIFLTALGDDETYLNAQNVSSFGYIIKPFEKNQLIKKINNALSQYKQHT